MKLFSILQPLKDFVYEDRENEAENFCLMYHIFILNYLQPQDSFQ